MNEQGSISTREAREGEAEASHVMGAGSQGAEPRESAGEAVAEIWKAVEGYEGVYEVSTAGRVKFLGRAAIKGSGGYPRPPRIFRHSGPRGYLQVKLGDRRFLVHRLVAAAFIPNPEGKPHINHINGVKNDNRRINLEWATQLENVRHAWMNGLAVAKRGSDANGAKLTWPKVDQIRARLESGESGASLGREFGVTQENISRIKRRVSWK